MARPREDILTRIARGLRMPLEDLTQFLSEERHTCLDWHGATSHRRPFLKRFGNPARALFAHVAGIETLHSRIWLRPHCGSSMCINPWHQRPTAAFSIYHNDRPPIPTLDQPSFDEVEVQGILEMLKEPDRFPLDDIRDLSKPEDYDEAQRRHSQSD